MLILDDGGLRSLLLHGTAAFVVRPINGIVIGVDGILKLELGIFDAPFDYVLHENLR